MKNRKRERKQRLTWRSPPSPPARPSPLARASHPPPLARRTRGAWPAPAATRRPPPASADAPDAPTSATPTPWTPRPLHSPPVSPLSLSPQKQGAAVAADKHHRSHRRPLVASSCQEVPPSSIALPRPIPERSLAPETLHRARLQPRSPEIPLAAPLAPALPRARRSLPCNRSELLTLLPLSVLALVHRTCRLEFTRTHCRLCSPPTSLRPSNGPAVVPSFLPAPRRARTCPA